MRDSKKSLSREELAEYDGTDRVISSYQLEESIKLRDGEDQGLCIKSGIPALDRHTEGFREGELIVISGPTGQGKTLFAQTITAHITNREDPQHPLWFSFEMPPKQFFRCFPSVPFFYMPQELKPYKWKWFEERCLENEAKHGGRVIITDHLHFLFEFFRTGSPSLEIGRLLRKLKRLAVDNNYIVFLIAHISKLPKGEKAGLHHIRDSSFIGQESDTVLMIQRIEDRKKGKKNRSCITVEKCRWTGVFGEQVYVNKVGGYLRELTDEFSL